MNGTPATGSIGLGVWVVNGRSRVPLPPTSMIASVMVCAVPLVLGVAVPPDGARLRGGVPRTGGPRSGPDRTARVRTPTVFASGGRGARRLPLGRGSGRGHPVRG